MIFTSIAIIALVTTPANTLFGVMPEAASIMASFERIQQHLLTPPLHDKREISMPESNGDGVMLVPGPHRSSSVAAVEFHNATIRPASAADPVLHSINTKCNKGDIVVVAGAVGVGKTTLAKAVLGDLPQDSGAIYMDSWALAYCSQTPWLTNGTIKEVICGPYHQGSVREDKKYRNVVHVCDLQEDIDQMPDGDQTVIGSRGVMLSGGQRQRVVRTSPALLKLSVGADYPRPWRVPSLPIGTLSSSMMCFLLLMRPQSDTLSTSSWDQRGCSKNVARRFSSLVMPVSDQALSDKRSFH